MSIPKAPVIEFTGDYLSGIDLRNHYHTYYMAEFVKWLKSHGTKKTLAGDDIYTALVVPYDDYEDLLREALK